MSNPAGQNTQAFELLRMLHLFFQPPLLFLYPLALRDVACDSQNPHGPLILVTQESHSRLSHDRGPVLANLLEFQRPRPVQVLLLAFFYGKFFLKHLHGDLGRGWG